jgi:uncharacterized protein YneF (UPF0154 family)
MVGVDKLNWINFILPIVALLIGIVIGFYFGVQFLKKQMMNMTLDDHQLKEMAKRMGYNLNSKQLQQVKQMQKKMSKGR